MNTRIVYGTLLVGCDSAIGVVPEYTLEAVTDYFPYGKILRQFIKTSEKYVTTRHERDVETGLDYRGARFYDSDVARFLSLDPLAAKFPAWSAYNYVLGNPVMFVDPDGKAPDDFVKREDGSIYWDNNANNQKTTKEGETYLGTELEFTFNSFIGSSYDGPEPVPFMSVGRDKLTTTLTVSAEENSKGELTKLNASKITTIGKTFGVVGGRDFYPGKGGDNNVFTITRGATPSTTINYEQHVSVPKVEEYGLNVLGYKIVDVSQKLNINYDSGSGNLSVNAYTNIFPSATLNLNNTGETLMNYPQPSFVETHKGPIIKAFPQSFSGRPIPHARDFSYYPAKFYKRN